MERTAAVIGNSAVYAAQIVGATGELNHSSNVGESWLRSSNASFGSWITKVGVSVIPVGSSGTLTMGPVVEESDRPWMHCRPCAMRWLGHSRHRAVSAGMATVISLLNALAYLIIYAQNWCCEQLRVKGCKVITQSNKRMSQVPLDHDSAVLVAEPDLGASRACSAYIYADPGDEMPAMSMRVSRDAVSDAEMLQSTLPKVFPAGVGDALDVGAGRGRMVPELLRYTQRLTAVEPDATRFAALSAGFSHIDTLELRNCDESELLAASGSEPRTFELITALHVIGHLSRVQRHQFLKAMRMLLGSDGTLILVVPTIERSERYLSVVRSADGASLSTQVVVPGEFDELAEHPLIGTLAVCHMSLGGVVTALRGAGLEVKDAWKYRSFSYDVINGDRKTLTADDTVFIVGVS